MQKIIYLILLILALELPSTSTKNMNHSILKNSKGHWKNLSISLNENSGSLAPEFRYTLYTSIVANKEGFFIYRKESQADKEIINSKKRISEKNYLQIMNKLLNLNVYELPIELEPKEKLMGVSYNLFSVKIGSKRSQFYYLLEDLKNSQFKNKKKIIEIMKGIKP